MTTKRHQIICLMGLKNVNFGVKRTGLGEEGRGGGHLVVYWNKNKY